MRQLADNLVNSPLLGTGSKTFFIASGFDFSNCSIAQPVPGLPAQCSSLCDVSAGSRALANYILKNPPPGNIVLIGYSMGGLIARDMKATDYLRTGILDFPPRFAKGRVIDLITLGTPNLGYPYEPIDEDAFCPQLVRDMGGGWLPLASPPFELSSFFLDQLRVDWTRTAYAGWWLAVAGTQASDKTRLFPFHFDPADRKGCLTAADGALSDGVVCRDSAFYSSSDASFSPAPAPSDRWQNNLYVHTDAYGGWGSVLLFG